ncbi:MAG: FHA domain-containing protein [Nitrospirae bacterium]|nr:FHA domain-containing protein [Nitrospirota bacterium]
MFTDIIGSTSIADKLGDIEARIMIKEQSDIMLPIIDKHDGVFVKSIGDGTMSYFVSAQSALRAAVEIQQGVARYNKDEAPKIPLRIRIGLHTGECLVEQNDIAGDVVNVSSRFEALASEAEVCFSGDTYNALEDKNEIQCVYCKDVPIKGKKGMFRLYKAAGTVGGTVYPTLIIQKDTMQPKQVPLDKMKILIGRSSDCDIVLDKPYVSRNHAEIFKENCEYIIEDSESLSGLMINGQNKERHTLINGDVIEIGEVTITFVYPSGPSGRDEQTVMVQQRTAESDGVSDTMPIHLLPRYKLACLSPGGEINEYEIPGDGLVIGRGAECNIQLHDKLVSLRHAIVFCGKDVVLIQDLGSTNGTYVNGRDIEKNVVLPLSQKQQVKIGPYMIVAVDIDENIGLSTFNETKSSILRRLKGILKPY